MSFARGARRAVALLLAALMCASCFAEEDCPGEHFDIEVNGVVLRYAAAGEGKPVVLVHGNHSSHAALAVEMRQLADAGYRVYAPDSRGQGANAPLEAYHYADMAEDMFRFIGALGLERPAFYGWSDGGIVGLMLELAHPGTLGLLAVSGANLFPEGADPAAVAQVAAMVKEHPDPLAELVLLEPHIDPAELAGIEIPVLVTAGEDDIILPEHTRLIAGSLPDAELRIVEGADHMSYIVGSEVMGEMLIEFLRAHGY